MKNIKMIGIMMFSVASVQAQEKVPGLVQLMCSDGLVSLTRSVAEKSPVLKAMLTQEGRGGEFRALAFKTVPVAVMNKIVGALRVLAERPDLQGKELKDELIAVEDFKSNAYLIEQVLTTAYDLKIKPLVEVAAYEFAGVLYYVIQTALRLKQMNTALFPEIAKQYFLRFGKEFDFATYVDTSVTFGISVQDLIDAGKIPSFEDWHGEKVLKLVGMHINSLEGLRSIPGIETIEHLDLSNNKLETLGSYFEGLKKLKMMNLSNNPLTTVGTSLDKLKDTIVIIKDVPLAEEERRRVRRIIEKRGGQLIVK